MSLSSTISLYTNKCYVEVDDSNRDFYETDYETVGGKYNLYNDALKEAFKKYYTKEGNVGIIDYTYGVGSDIPIDIPIYDDNPDDDDNPEDDSDNPDDNPDDYTNVSLKRTGSSATVVPSNLKYIVLSYIVYSTTEKPRVITVSYKVSIESNDEIPDSIELNDVIDFYSCLFNIVTTDIFIYEKNKLKLIDSIEFNQNTIDYNIGISYENLVDCLEFYKYSSNVEKFYILYNKYDSVTIGYDSMILEYNNQWYNYIQSYNNAELRSYFYVTIDKLEE